MTRIKNQGKGVGCVLKSLLTGNGGQRVPEKEGRMVQAWQAWQVSVQGLCPRLCRLNASRSAWLNFRVHFPALSNDRLASEPSSAHLGRNRTRILSRRVLIIPVPASCLDHDTAHPRSRLATVAWDRYRHAAVYGDHQAQPRKRQGRTSQLLLSFSVGNGVSRQHDVTQICDSSDSA